MSDKSEYRRQVEAAWKQGQARHGLPTSHLRATAQEARENLVSARATVPSLTALQTAAFASALLGLDRLMDATRAGNGPPLDFDIRTSTRHG